MIEGSMFLGGVVGLILALTSAGGAIAAVSPCRSLFFAWIWPTLRR
jgi:hypothetical protein